MNQNVPDYLNEINSAIERLNESFKPIAQAFFQFQTKIENLFEINPDFLSGIHRLVEEFKTLPERQRQAWELAAKQGWYVNWYTPISAISAIRENSDDNASLDNFMLSHLKEDFEQISKSICKSFPSRSQILECAFNLHLEKNYIASIPLFLSQADGICSEVLGAYLFTEKKIRKNKISELQTSNSELTTILINLLSFDTQLSAKICSSSEEEKRLAPNRHGIMHGSKDHLDYGTELNSYKSFSLLSFVSFVIK